MPLFPGGPSCPGAPGIPLRPGIPSSPFWPAGRGGGGEVEEKVDKHRQRGEKEVGK